MTKAEKIRALEMMMPSLPEDVISAFMTLAQAQKSPAQLDFNLTPQQLLELARSREDFAAGRTLTIDQAEARTDAFLATL